jgi:phage gp36-like protein
MTYVTPSDMKSLYNEETLIQATNYTDPNASSINEPQLTSACDMGSAIADSYLSLLPLDPAQFNERFRTMLKVHCARLALDSLDGASADPQIREHAKEALEWLKALTKLGKEELKNLATNTDETPEELPLNLVAPSVGFVEEGRRWELSF